MEERSSRINAEAFLSFDNNQRKRATAAGLTLFPTTV